MTWLYRHIARPWLFGFDSEEVHNRTLGALAWVSNRPLALQAVGSFFESDPLPVQLWDLQFPNPVGLAAGMDKHAVAVPVWAAFGFGFAELGGATWLAQPGNPAPRMFRAVESRALVNRMGFNNPGARAISAQLVKWRQSGLWPRHPIGMNLGKSKDTPLEAAAQDYASSLEALWPVTDFFVVNVSSPNTPNLRQLQDKSALTGILEQLRSVNQALAAAARRAPKPILVKVAPDLSWTALDEIAEVAFGAGLAGIVATNTTIERPSGGSERARKTFAETGGLSGAPLARRSTEVIRHLFQQTKGRLPIIGVGGIFDAEDAWEKVVAGATLLQVYTGLVYEGPTIARNLVAGLRGKLEQHQLRDWADLPAYRASLSR